MSGKKFDEGKLRFDLCPPEAEEGLAGVLTCGANKYGDRNWEKGIAWGRVYGAVRRHLQAFWKGEDLDPESGLPHLDHALCGIAFLTTYYKRGIGADDRPGRVRQLELPFPKEPTTPWTANAENLTEITGIRVADGGQALAKVLMDISAAAPSNDYPIDPWSEPQLSRAELIRKEFPDATIGHVRVKYD